MNSKLLSLYGLKFHPFRPDVPLSSVTKIDGKQVPFDQGD
jgi:hypothetical protein